jgi:hypothetical protein
MLIKPSEYTSGRPSLYCATPQSMSLSEKSDDLRELLAGRNHLMGRSPFHSYPRRSAVLYFLRWAWGKEYRPVYGMGREEWSLGTKAMEGK